MRFLRNKIGRNGWLYAVAVILPVVATILGVLLGGTQISLSDLAEALFGGDRSSPEARILWYVRLPRVCASLLCGGALAVSGAVIQGVLSNRLASPSIIGVNSGAGLAVTLCAASGIAGGWRISLAAFFGAFLAVMLVSLGARRWGATRGTGLLMGVALNALFGAISDTVITLFPEVSVMSNDFRIGDFSAVTYIRLIPAAILIFLGIGILFTLQNELEVLTLGEENAKGLGMNTGVVRVLLLLLAALLAGVAVSLAGLISFVGLLVPHAVRRLSGGNRHLLPLCALFGAGFVTLCDTLARWGFAPYEIPVGIVMAFLGAPFFLFILLKGREANSHD